MDRLNEVEGCSVDHMPDRPESHEPDESTPSHVVVIRGWFEHGTFRARMILDADSDAALVVIADSVDWLCDSLRAFFAERAT